MKEKTPAQFAQEVFEKHIKTIPVEIEPLFKHYGLQLVKKDLDSEISGMLVLNGGQKFIVINQNQSPQRQRFTAMHELGHFILHKKDNDYFLDTTIEWRRENPEGLNRKQEIQANEFAANLLMPEKEIQRIVEEKNYNYFDDVEIAKMAKLFKVSKPAMKIRLVSLGYIADWDID